MMKKTRNLIGFIVILTILFIFLSVLFVSSIKSREPTRAKLVLHQRYLSGHLLGYLVEEEIHDKEA
jgi:hypothetical protein